MNIVIPLGGSGTRFIESGYITPKPLIKALGKELIFWVLDNLKLSPEDRLYIPYNHWLKNYGFEKIIKVKYPTAKFLPIVSTKGAADTVNQCIEAFKLRGKTLILDGDTWYKEDILALVRANSNNSIGVFDSVEDTPIYSYVTVDSSGQINRVEEKVKISDLANSGCYGFTNAELFSSQYQLCDKSKEVYISEIIKGLLLRGEVFNPIKVSDFHILGTPQQISDFSKKHTGEPKRFVFDLDNTLVTYPKIEGDYTTVDPIEKNIKFLRSIYESGHTVIIYTARRMRTHSGNVGGVIADIGSITLNTLKSFNIPYHEIYFGKPYGNFYIDDLMNNPDLDLNKELGYYFD